MTSVAEAAGSSTFLELNKELKIPDILFFH
jgi:hypothetical protein